MLIAVWQNNKEIGALRVLIRVELKWLSWGSGRVGKKAEPGEDGQAWGNLEEPRD